MNIDCIRRFLRTLAAGALVAACAPLCVAAAQEDAAPAFVGGNTDLPIMEGLEEIEGSAVYFDSVSGRILEARFGGPLRPEKVRAFYAGTLAQLGWSPSTSTDSRLTFTREGEVLELETVATAGGVELILRLGPEER